MCIHNDDNVHVATSYSVYSPLLKKRQSTFDGTLLPGDTIFCLIFQGDAGTPSGMSNGTDAFEQIAATEKEHVEAESPLPISTDSGI